MNDTVRVISQATGCSLAEAQKAIGALIALGWTPPDADHLAGDDDELPGPTPALPGFPAVSADDVLVPLHSDFDSLNRPRRPIRAPMARTDQPVKITVQRC